MRNSIALMCSMLLSISVCSTAALSKHVSRAVSAHAVKSSSSGHVSKSAATRHATPVAHHKGNGSGSKGVVSNIASRSERASRSGRTKVTRLKGGRRSLTAAGAKSAKYRTVTKVTRTEVVTRTTTRSRYAYPLNFFMMNSPEFDRSPLSREASEHISRSFHRGYADEFAARSLVRAGIVSYHPLHGGIFWRREPIKYIIMHSTETGVPVSATNVINGWNSSGRRHPGAQYVVERDGTIFQAVDPDLGTVHVNIFKTLPGINNDNSIGIEMNHTGRQDYPSAQREAVVKLVTYLQQRYRVPDENVITHRYAQQGDHTDPVNFDWEGFLATKNSFKNKSLAYKVKRLKEDVRDWSNVSIDANNPVEPQGAAPTTYLQPHRAITTYDTVLAKPAAVTTTTTVTSTTVLAPVSPATPSSVYQSTKMLPSPVMSTSATERIYSAGKAVSNSAPVGSVTTDTLLAPTPGSLSNGVKVEENVQSTTETSQETAPVIMVPMSDKAKRGHSRTHSSDLRGPIEMSPQDAAGLNSMPAKGSDVEVSP